MIPKLFGQVDRVSYRRLLAWLVTVGLFVAGLVSEGTFLAVTTMFVGGEALERSVQALRAKGGG